MAVPNLATIARADSGICWEEMYSLELTGTWLDPWANYRPSPDVLIQNTLQWES